MERRYDIDWLRVIAIGLLLIYHIAIVFQPWGLMIGFIQSKESLTWLWPAMSLLNVWRIPLLFYVSGMGVYFALRKRNWLGLIKERTMRIWLPFVVGLLAVVPLHMLILQNHYGIPLQFQPHPGHLWFLANIFTYVLIFSPLFVYLKKKENTPLHHAVQRFFGSPLGLLAVMLVMVGEVQLVRPDVFELYVLTWHGYFLGLLAFLFGFGFMYAGQAFIQNLYHWKWLWLVMGIGFYMTRILVYQFKAPNYLLSIESNCWIFAIMAFGHEFLQRPGKALTYLSEAAYPVYIWHMAFLYLGTALILPMEMPTELKLVSLILFTFVGCFGMFELIKRTKMTRLLFGMKI